MCSRVLDVLIKLLLYVTFKLIAKKFIYGIKMDELENVTIQQDMTEKAKRLVGEHVITEDQANKMSSEEINKEYNKFESKIIRGITKDTTNMVSHIYTQLLEKTLPMTNLKLANPEQLQKSIDENVFLQRYINRIVPQLYFSGYASYLLPISLAVTTVPHIEKAEHSEQDFLNLIENGRREETAYQSNQELIRANDQNSKAATGTEEDLI